MDVDPEVAERLNKAESYIDNAMEAYQEPVEGGPKPADFIAIAQVQATLALAVAVEKAGRQIAKR